MKIKKALLIALVPIAALAIFLLGKPQPAHAQFNNYQTPAVAVFANPTNVASVYGGAGWTNWISGSSAFENDTKIDTMGFRDVSLQFRFRCAAANAAAITVALGRNNDGAMGTTNIELFSAFSATANGTATVTVCTNLASVAGSGWGSHRYLYIMYITNAAAAAGGVTNYSIVPWMK